MDMFVLAILGLWCVGMSEGVGSFVQRVVEQSGVRSAGFEACRAKGECFSGAWLGTVKHLLDNPLIEKIFPNEEIKNKSQSPYRIRCEDASFYFFHHMFEVKRDPTPGWGVWPVQTIDLLDFSVLHLSTLERGQRHCLQPGLSRKQKHMEKHVMNQDAARQLQNLRHNFFNEREKSVTSIRKRSIGIAKNKSEISDLEKSFSRTLVIMPFLVTTTGESGTSVANKKLYFKLCFDSIYPIFKNIMGAVISAKDRDILKTSRPFRDVLLFNENNNDCELPLRALLAVKRMMKTDAEFAASFDFIYFTEGDQVLVGRQFPQIFSYLRTNPYSVLTPHRLVLTPPCVLGAHNRSASEAIPIQNVLEYSCCMDVSSFGLTRTHWKSLASHATTVLQLFGMDAVAGNGDLFKQVYRTCNVTTRVHECPKRATFLDFHTGSDEAIIFAPHMKEQARLYYDSRSSP